MPTCAAGALASSAAAVTGATVGAARASGSAVASRLLACAIGTTLPLVNADAGLSSAAASIFVAGASAHANASAIRLTAWLVASTVHDIS